MLQNLYFLSVTVSFDPITYTVTEGKDDVVNISLVRSGDLTRTIVVTVTTVAGMYLVSHFRNVISRTQFTGAMFRNVICHGKYDAKYSMGRGINVHAHSLYKQLCEGYLHTYVSPHWPRCGPRLRTASHI